MSSDEPMEVVLHRAQFNNLCASAQKLKDWQPIIDLLEGVSDPVQVVKDGLAVREVERRDKFATLTFNEEEQAWLYNHNWNNHSFAAAVDSATVNQATGDSE